MFLNPPKGAFTVDSTFDVSVLINTSGYPINAVDLEVDFPADKLQVVNPSNGHSLVSIWISQPTFSNTAGTIKLTGGIPVDGIKTSSGLLTTITFRVKAAGEATVKISNKTKAYLADGSGAEIKVVPGIGIYTLTPLQPGGPTVQSVTHPDQNHWYNNNNVTFNVEPEEGIQSYSYALDQNPAGIPDTTDDTASTSLQFPNVEDGVWYLHVRQKREGVYSDTSTYKVQIDTHAPAEFTPQIQFLSGLISQPALLTFATTDSLSGIDHYEVAVFDPEKDAGEAPVFVEVQSPYRIPDVQNSRTKIIVRAFDKANNTRDGGATTQVFSIWAALRSTNATILYILLIMAFVVRYIWSTRRHHAPEEKPSLQGAPQPVPQATGAMYHEPSAPEEPRAD